MESYSRSTPYLEAERSKAAADEGEDTEGRDIQSHQALLELVQGERITDSVHRDDARAARVSDGFPQYSHGCAG